jgi:predicted Zn-dependent peptidase
MLGCVLVALAASSCGGEPATRPPPPPPPRAATTADAKVVSSDPLGSRPDLGQPAPFAPPVPVQYKRDNGLAVWLLERHNLPIVSMQLVVPAGSAQDPEGKGGLAAISASMLHEGAGTRGALQLSGEILRLGATLESSAHADYGYVQLTVLKKNLGPAANIFGDVVAKPQMSPVEFKRVHDLWENSLKARQSEPDAVANVVVSRKLYPAGHPYAHPTDGTMDSVKKVTLDDVKKFYGTRWRPDRATLVVVGDVTRAEVDALLDQALSSWKAPKTAPTVDPPPDVAGSLDALGRPSAPAPAPKGGRRVIIVDRPDAPQSVVALARPGVSAFEDVSSALVRVNGALGGSFTSRLNQDLREAHGWSYGAHSRFSFSRMRGAFVAEAAVHTEHTGEALKAMLTDVEGIAKNGLTNEEVEKTKQLARADLVESFETVHATAARLGRNAGIGQTADHEAASAKRTSLADKGALDKAAAAHVDVDSSLVVIVGPRAQIEPQLKSIGITSVEVTGPEGQ